MIKPSYYIQYVPPVSLSGFVGCDGVGRLWNIPLLTLLSFILHGDIIMGMEKKNCAAKYAIRAASQLSGTGQ